MLMRFTLIMLTFLTSCSSLMPLADDVEKMVDNDAITIKVDKDAIQRDTDVTVNVQVTNKEIPIQK